MSVKKYEPSVAHLEHLSVTNNKTASSSHPWLWWVIISLLFNDVVCFCEERHGVKLLACHIPWRHNNYLAELEAALLSSDNSAIFHQAGRR